MRISDWSSDVCSSDLRALRGNIQTWYVTLMLNRLDQACVVLQALWLGIRLLTQFCFLGQIDDGFGVIDDLLLELFCRAADDIQRHILGGLNEAFRCNVFGQKIGRASCRERLCQYV